MRSTKCRSSNEEKLRADLGCHSSACFAGRHRLGDRSDHGKAKNCQGLAQSAGNDGLGLGVLLAFAAEGRAAADGVAEILATGPG